MRVRFGDHTFDEKTRRLFQGGKLVAISELASTLLWLLIESRPQTRSRDDLRGALWPRATPPDGALASLVLELRGAIETRGQKEAIRRTLSPAGYAFVAETAEDLRPMAGAAGYRFVLLWDDREIPLSEGANLIGRDYDADVRLDDAKVSRRHARITVDGERATLEDLQSRNGTRHNGRRLERAVELADRDEISVGRLCLVFSSRALNGGTPT